MRTRGRGSGWGASECADGGGFLYDFEGCHWSKGRTKLLMETLNLGDFLFISRE